MVIFNKLFRLFDKNKAHEDLLNLYSEINDLSLRISLIISNLREMQEEIVESKIKMKGYSSKRTGGISLQKTRYLKEYLLPELEKLSAISENQFYKLSQNIHATEPVSPLEKKELGDVKKFLTDLHSAIPILSHLPEGSEQDKIKYIETVLREMTKIATMFHKVKLYEDDLARKVLENEISPLLKRIYGKPIKKEGMLISVVTKQELRKLELESERIMRSQDPNFKVIWQRWWRELQFPEIDLSTELKDPHINVTIKLFGKKPKDIHLILKS